MARLVFGMNQSLDGYVDHMAFAPSPTLFRHFIEEAQGQAGSVYGRQMYEVMRYWTTIILNGMQEEHAFAAAWRNQPKWVVAFVEVGRPQRDAWRMILRARSAS